jgi:hypothetical protein
MFRQQSAVRQRMDPGVCAQNVFVFPLFFTPPLFTVCPHEPEES